MDLSVITEITEDFEDELELEIPPRTPFVGRYFNATRAGIHAGGLLKDEEIYNIFNTEKYCIGQRLLLLILIRDWLALHIG